MSKQPAPQEARWPEGAVFTVGHSTLPTEQVIALLHAYGIACVADIRDGLDDGQLQKARAARSSLLDRIVPDPDRGAITLHYRVCTSSHDDLHGLSWRPQGDSNPCYNRERVVS